MTAADLIGKVITCRGNGTRWIVVRIADPDEFEFIWVIAADGSGEETCTACTPETVEQYYEVGGAEA